MAEEEKKVMDGAEAVAEAPKVTKAKGKKGTAYAAQIAAEKALEIAKREHGLNSVDVFVSGIGLGRDSAIRAVSNVGIKIDSITDVTPIAHGGVRPKGERKP